MKKSLESLLIGGLLLSAGLLVAEPNDDADVERQQNRLENQREDQKRWDQQMENRQFDNQRQEQQRLNKKYDDKRWDEEHRK